VAGDAIVYAGQTNPDLTEGWYKLSFGQTDLTDYTKRNRQETIISSWTFTARPTVVSTSGVSELVVGAGTQAGEARVRLVNPQETTGIDVLLASSAKQFGFYDRTRSEWAMRITDNTLVEFGTRRVRGAAGTENSDYTTLAQIRTENWAVGGNWTISGTWRFNTSVSLGNNVNLSGWNAANNGTITIALVDSSNIVQFGSPSTIANIRTNGDLRLNNAQLNQPNGLVKVAGSGKLPVNLLPFSSLSFQGTWDASGGTNPPDGTEGGQFYVIIKEGDLLVFVDDSGTPVLTTVLPGDYLLWLGAGTGLTPGWYYIKTEAPTLVDSNNVFYDNTTSPWTSTIVQDVLDEIGSRATLRDRAETISSGWTFNGLVLHGNAIRMASTNVQFDSDSGTVGTQFRTVAGAVRWLLARQPSDNVFGLWRYDAAGQFVDRPVIFKDDGTAQFSGRVAGVAASVANEFPILSQTDGRYGRKASAETISAAWNFTAQPTINGVNIATVNDIPAPPDLTPYAQKAANESITGNWTFSTSSGASLTTFQTIVNLSGGNTFFSTADHYWYNSSSGGGGNVVRFRTRETGSLGVYPRGSTTDKLVGFRNPGVVRTMTTPLTLAQSDEGQVVSIVSTGAALTIPSLELGTQITLIQKAAAGGSTPFTLSGVTAFVMDAGSAYAATGAITLDAGGVAHLQWESATVVNIWGSGLKRA